MYSRLRPLLFRIDPERTHTATLKLLQLVGALPPLAFLVKRMFSVADTQPVNLIGLRFPNYVGLAAGYDKDGLSWRGLACLGFGHIEIGTVTPKPQPGNQQPRLFRLVEDNALINRLGFPSRGADFVIKRLQGPRPGGLIIGVNLGMNKDTPLDQAANDYQYLMKKFNPLADYLVVNVSSPNTPGLRQLQGAQALDQLLKALSAVREKPLLVKLAPDLTNQQLDEALAAILENGVNGVIATNTTLSRPELISAQASETGGLSGAPLSPLTRKIVGYIYTHTQGKLPIIAAGGIMNRQDAEAAINTGASLVQVFTGLIYKGPSLVKEIFQPD
jgi:dihydroorotate dehydrogenase